MTQPRIYYGETDQGNFVVAGANGELDYDGAPPTPRPTAVRAVSRSTICSAGAVRVELPRYQPAAVQPDHRLEPLDDLSQHRAASRESRPVPDVRQRPDLSIVGGRPVWILDAYTTSDGYPYSQAVSGTVATDGLLGGTFNYMRNSVKVVIDAYDGTVTYYADLTEPIIQVWAKRLSDPLHPDRRGPVGASRHTSATRRTCSRCRPISSRTTT